MKLQEIAEIRTGLLLTRKKAKIKMGHSYQMFTLGSFEKEGQIDEDLCEIFESHSVIEDRVLSKEGDVLMRLSQPYTAVYITKQYQNILIPSLVAILRIQSDRFLPEYIKVYLNSEAAKAQIRKEANGTVIPTISTKALREIEVPEISLQKQQYLIHFTNAYLEEKKLTKKIEELKQKEYQWILNENTILGK